MNLRNLLLVALTTSAACADRGDEPLSRDAAARIVIDELVGGTDPVVVLGFRDPLSAGDTIEAYHPAEMPDPDATLAAEGDAWFFWIDDAPGAQFDHPSRFVLVDRETGEVTTVDSRWWPVLDGQGLWTDQDAYWSGNDWVHSTIDVPDAPRRGSLFGSILPLLDCSTGGGHGVVINGWATGESGRHNFDNDGANMSETFEGAGLDTTYFGPEGSEGVDQTATRDAMDRWFSEKAMELAPGDTLVVFVTGHGWVNDAIDWKRGETQIGSVWESDLEAWLAMFDPGVEIVVMVNGCHSGGMLDTLSCVADLAVSATDEEKSSYGDVDLEGDPNPQDSGSEWSSSMLTCWGTLMEDQAGIDGVQARAGAAGKGFFRQLVGECFAGAGDYDDAARRGWSAPQTQDGAAKTAGTPVEPDPPVCDPDDPTDPTDPTDPADPTDPTGPACEDPELAAIAMALGELLGAPSGADAACEEAVEEERGNEVLHSDGVKTSTAEGEVDLLLRGHLLDLVLPDIDEDLPCGEGPLGPTLCPYETSAAEGPWVAMYGTYDGALALDGGMSYYQYGFVFDVDGDDTNNYQAPPQWPADSYDGTDRWYQIFADPYGFGLDVLDATGGVITPVPSAARVLVLESGLLVLIPESELGDASEYRFTSFTHGGDWGTSGPWSGDVTPAVGQPLVPLR
jgi:hypothetical protein